ncbi:hypothetical protein P168DRAFT_306389 [Aspergillus campestris IBT 28561]|uniref:Uncharacterized protein n=1 Tax=Aspergillus campestris (strain IBT 28561) TaxID=1392248 RepID=A0A2I1CX68_ASPC2|nr:uncharacterized protein P168DRAFT_306389 [Aspergillus campestris IBT 28561]PKY02209.1 hypothetical protein P168DRAFT_306389 [Aspergillus campestris IBT 28561]
MTHTIDLGETSLSTSDLTLEITLHTSIEVAFTGPWSEENVGILEEAIHSGNVWLDQTPELRLYIYIKATQSHIYPISNVTSNVADIIYTSKIWHDLGLTVYLKSCKYNEQEDGIQVSLGARKASTRSALVKRSRIPTWLRNPQEAHPPPAVPVASVSTINVVLGINTYDELYASTFPVWSPDVPNWIEPCVPSTTPVDNEDGELNILDKLYQIQEGENSQPDTYINDDFTFSAEDDHNHTSHEFVSLFTNGLKGIVAGPSQQGNCHTTTAEFEPTQSLSQIVPTVFSPGYREVLNPPPKSLSQLTRRPTHQAMNQRAQLIPSIAKSITSLLKTTRNPILREQASNLQYLYPKLPKAAQNFHPPPETDIIHLRDTIKTSLWRIAQKQLYDPQAALKLQSHQETTAGLSFERSLLSEDSLLEAFGEDVLGENYPREDTISDSYIGTDDDAAEGEEEGDICSLLSFERETTISPSSTFTQQDIVRLDLCPDQEPLLCSLLEHAPRGNEVSLLNGVEYEIHSPGSLSWLREERDCVGDESDYMLCD